MSIELALKYAERSTIDRLDEFSWAIGLFEGEGCITLSYTKTGKGTARALKLNTTDADIAERFGEAVKCGVIRYNEPRQEGYKSFWSWECRRWEEIENLLERMLPYLGERRRVKAEEMLSNPPKVEHKDKLSISIARDIRRRYAGGKETQTSLALEYGVSQGAISLIVLGKNYKDEE